MTSTERPDEHGGRLALPSDELLSASRDEWLGVEVRHLAAVSAVAREGSFRAAAERLGYVQSSISQQVAQLERLIGHRLIERSRGGGRVAVTEAGERLLEYSDEILSRLRAARADLASLADGRSSRARVGLCQGVAAKLMPRILPAFSRRWPRATVKTTEVVSDMGLFQLIRDGAVDLIFTDLPVDPGSFTHRPLLRDPYVLIVPKGAPLARRGRTPTWSEIARLPLAGRKSSRYLSRLEAHMASLGLEPRFVYRSDIDASVQAMVATAGGAAIATQLIADDSDERIELVDLSSLICPRVVALAWSSERQLAPSVAGFVELAARVCERSTGSRLGHEAPVADQTPRVIRDKPRAKRM